MKFPVRLFLAVFFFLISFLCLRSVAFAQSTVQTSQPQQNLPYMTANTNPDVPKNLHTWTQSVLIEVIAATSCAITGMDPTDPSQKCLGVDQKTGKIGYVQNGGGAIGILASNLTAIYTPPLHTKDYISYLFKNFGLAKPSYASASITGFDQLSPVTNIWVAFRNITYVFFVIVFLVIGIAIMLRVRIDPRTVMTIQNQIPKIIIGVILVTFSFAIAGFLIDLMWTSMYVLFGILNNIPPGSQLAGLDPSAMQGQTALSLLNNDAFVINGAHGLAGVANYIAVPLQDIFRHSLGIATTTCTDPGNCMTVNAFDPSKFSIAGDPNGLISQLFDLISWITGGTVFYRVSMFVATAASSIPFLGSVGGAIVGGGTGFVMGLTTFGLTQYLLRNFVPWLIIFVVIYIAMFVALIRLWFELIKAYMFILFDVIFAPFWIMAGLLPGNTTVNFSSWIRDLAANLFAFPAVAAMFMLAKIIMTGFTNSTSSSPFVPPLVGNPGDPNFLASIIGLAIILSSPQVVIMVKKAVKAPAINIGAVTQGIGAGASVLTSGAKGVAAYVMPNPKYTGRGGLGAVFRRFM